MKGPWQFFYLFLNLFPPLILYANMYLHMNIVCTMQFCPRGYKVTPVRYCKITVQAILLLSCYGYYNTSYLLRYFLFLSNMIQKAYVNNLAFFTWVLNIYNITVECQMCNLYILYLLHLLLNKKCSIMF